MLSVNTNISAIQAHYYMEQNSNALNLSLQRLSSGLRINGASDDAAGLAIAQKMQGQVNGLNQASSNAQDAINLLQTADGALNETDNILQRMRTLAVQAANDTLTASDRSNITDEMTALSKEIDRIAGDTQFNTTNLLNGGSVASKGFTFQIGANAGQVLNVTIATANAAALTVGTTNLTVSSASFASTTLANIDNAINQVSAIRSTLGANVNRLQHTVSNLDVESQNMQASLSQIQDVDMAAEASNLTREQILMQSSQAMRAQANSTPQGLLRLIGG